MTDRKELLAQEQGRELILEKPTGREYLRDTEETLKVGETSCCGPLPVWLWVRPCPALGSTSCSAERSSGLPGPTQMALSEEELTFSEGLGQVHSLHSLI